MARRDGNLKEIEIFYTIRDKIKFNPLDPSLFDLFKALSEKTISYLDSKCTVESCPSPTIPNKNYILFIEPGNTRKSRAINKDLLTTKIDDIDIFLEKLREKQLNQITPMEITKSCYSMVISLAAVVDLNNPGDKQTPGNYYEKLVTFILSNYFGVLPSLSRITVPIGSDDISLTMDLIIDFGIDKSKLSIAIKNSTRERGSEFWAHQRILDKAFGENIYKGIFFGLAESKKNSLTSEVVEICVPDQWRAYQQYISKISNFYYLDPPSKYLDLNDSVPKLDVKEFGYFFSDYSFISSEKQENTNDSSEHDIA